MKKITRIKAEAKINIPDRVSTNENKSSAIMACCVVWSGTQYTVRHVLFQGAPALASFPGHPSFSMLHVTLKTREWPGDEATPAPPST
jgi:hypothetical protein